MGFLQAAEQLRPIHFAVKIKHRVVGTIVFAGETEGVGGGVAAQAIFVAENISSERSVAEEQLFEFIEDQFGGRILVTVDFIDDNLHFFLDLVLWIDAVEDHIRENVHGAVHIAAEHRGAIHRFLFAGESVEFAAHAFQVVVDLS